MVAGGGKLRSPAAAADALRSAGLPAGARAASGPRPGRGLPCRRLCRDPRARPSAGGACRLPPAPERRVTERLVATASRLLERRTSRRGILVRVAIGGSALAVAPLRYLL